MPLKVQTANVSALPCRCGLAGCDLNRQWDKPQAALHPTIYHTKRLMAALADTGRLCLFVDLHGHSTRECAFFFGCEPPPSKASDPGADPGAPDGLASERGPFNQPAGLSLRDASRLRVRLLPHLCAARDAAYSYTASTFNVNRHKLSAGRIVVARELGVAHSYTMETSLAGGLGVAGGAQGERPQGAVREHFLPSDLLRLGESLCLSIHDLLCVGAAQAAAVTQLADDLFPDRPVAPSAQEDDAA